MTTAAAAWFVGITLAVRLTSVQANTGIGQELIYIVARSSAAACSPAASARRSAPRWAR